MTKTNILFPIETINRELDFRLFLAAQYVSPRNRVFVGWHHTIHRLAQHSRGGVYLGQRVFSTFPSSLARYETLKRNGYIVMHLHEEGAVFAGDDEDWKKTLRRRLDPGVLCAEDYVCAWGDFQADYYRSLSPACAANIHVTGHPRLDLYKSRYREYFAPDAERLKKTYGDFILINSNFALANNENGIRQTFSAEGGYNPLDTQSRSYGIGVWAHAAHSLSNFMVLINQLIIDFPTTNIIIRPHPSDDRGFFSHLFKGVRNVHVLHEGGVGPWLLASRMMLHDGCTTGIEAFLCDVDIINYKSATDTRYDLFLPNIFGVQCHSQDEAMKAIRSLLEPRESAEPAQDLSDKAHSLLFNFKHDSFAKMTSVMEEAEARARAKESGVYNELPHRAHEWKDEMVTHAKSVVRPFFPERRLLHKSVRSRFYGFDKADIDGKLKRIQKILGKEIRCQFHSKFLVSIECD